MKTITNEQLVILAAAIASGKVSDEQLADCKTAAFEAMQGMLAGEVLTAEQVAINSYVARTMQKAVVHASKYAETEKAAAAAKAKFEQELQKYEIDTFNEFAAWLKNEATEINRLKSDKTNVNRLTVDAVKAKFSGFIAHVQALPSKPAKLVVKSSKSSGTGTYSSDSYSNPKPADISKLVEGSISKCIYDTLCGGKFTKAELLKFVASELPDKTEGAIRVGIEKAINGRFPVTVENNKLFIVPVAPTPAEVVEK